MKEVKPPKKPLIYYYGVALVVPDAKHHPAGMLMSFHQHHAQSAIAHSQIGMSQPLKKRLWQKLVCAKIENQAAVLRGIGSDHAAALSAMSAQQFPDFLHGR